MGAGARAGGRSVGRWARKLALGALSVVGFVNDIEKRFNFTRFSFPYRRFSEFAYEPPRTQEYAGALEQGLQDEAEPVIA